MRVVVGCDSKILLLGLVVHWSVRLLVLRVGSRCVFLVCHIALEFEIVLMEVDIHKVFVVVAQLGFKAGQDVC